MGSTTFSGAVTSTNGFVGDVTGNVTGAVTGTTVSASTSMTTGGGTAITKVLQGTVSVTVASQVGAAEEDIDVTVTGAAVGDAVIVNPTDAAAEANLSFCCWVSAANTVTIRATASGAISGSTANWTYQVTSIA